MYLVHTPTVRSIDGGRSTCQCVLRIVIGMPSLVRELAADAGGLEVPRDLETLRTLRLRYFTEREVLNLLGFPPVRMFCGQLIPINPN
eukprot:SAG31_NODE_953_length_10799_cov_4.245657_6_plen_88_part_00